MHSKLISFAGYIFLCSLLASGCNSFVTAKPLPTPTPSPSPLSTDSIVNTKDEYITGVNSPVDTKDEYITGVNSPEMLSPHLEIDLSRREVTLYQGEMAIRHYPVAVGRSGWETPTGTFEVQQMKENPTWINPFTDERVPGGSSQNPLGTRWIGFWTDGHLWIGLHGTPDPRSVGAAVSHGCIRMHNADIEELFAQISPGTPVTVVQ